MTDGCHSTKPQKRIYIYIVVPSIMFYVLIKSIVSYIKTSEIYIYIFASRISRADGSREKS